MEALIGKMYTTRELAARFGCSVSTIHKHANKLFGKTRGGSTRYFDGEQVTLLLERIKNSKSDNPTLNKVREGLQGVETELTLDLQIAMAEKAATMAEKSAKELWKRKAEHEEAQAVKAEAALGRLTVQHKNALQALRRGTATSARDMKQEEVLMMITETNGRGKR
jgi:DNA-binding transcriptional MerR regulator